MTHTAPAVTATSKLEWFARPVPAGWLVGRGKERLCVFTRRVDAIVAADRLNGLEQRAEAAEAKLNAACEINEAALRVLHSTDYQSRMNQIDEARSILAGDLPKCPLVEDMEWMEGEWEKTKAHLTEAEKFKSWVHSFLDAQGVPHDPDPEANKQHGCRISGRMQWVFGRLSEARLDVACDSNKRWHLRARELQSKLTAAEAALLRSDQHKIAEVQQLQGEAAAMREMLECCKEIVESSGPQGPLSRICTIPNLIHHLLRNTDAGRNYVPAERHERLFRSYEELANRIKEIALDVAPDYPNVADVAAREHLWAIHEGYKGTKAACGDLHEQIAALQQQLADSQTRLDRIRVMFPRDKTPGLPIVPVSQTRYDELVERLAEVERERDGWHAKAERLHEISAALQQQHEVSQRAMSDLGRNIAALAKALRHARHIIHKGIEVRCMEQWPVLKQLIPPCLKEIDEALELSAREAESGEGA